MDMLAEMTLRLADERLEEARRRTAEMRAIHVPRPRHAHRTRMSAVVAMIFGWLRRRLPPRRAPRQAERCRDAGAA